MEINYTIFAREPESVVLKRLVFNDLSFGDVFTTEEDRNLYIKTNTACFNVSLNRYAVNLETGQFKYFDYDCPVFRYQDMAKINKAGFSAY